jgi:Protein of unknown function (DUF2889)
MSLSPASPRQRIHARQVHCHGYRRDDGLWDIEGHLVDTKTYGFDSDYRGRVEAGDPVHEMWVRLSVDDDLIVRDVEAVTDKSPFPVCPAIAPNFKRLIGLSIRPGFLSKVRERLGGIEGCTHLVELMGPIATTAYQTIYPYRHRLARERADAPPQPPQERPRLIGTCHAFRSDGEIVRKLWPDYYTGARN